MTICQCLRLGSDFAWSTTGLIGYRFGIFGLDCSAVAGYRALSQDYATASGTSGFKWDVTMHGPVMGLVTRF